MVRISMPVAVAIVCATLGLASAAEAQSYSNIGSFVSFPNANRGRNISVLQRERPEYAALGVRAGAFMIFPSAQLGAGHTDNTLATAANKRSDTYFDFKPRVAIESDWSRHSISLNGSLADRRYSDLSSENYTDWNVNASGRLEVAGDSYFQGGAEAKRDHITRDQISFPTNGAEPVPTTTTDVFARGVYQGGRIRLLGNVVVAKVNFKDINSNLGGKLDQDTRDFDNVALTARGDYAISPDTALFGEVRRTSYNYDTTTTTGLKRDSTQTEGLAGANFDLTSLVRGEIGVGYMRREYDDPAFKNISGFALRGRVEYFPTQITTVTLEARRSVEDSILASTGGYLSTYGSLRVDHELLRNLLLNATVAHESDSFRGADRKDKITDFTLGANYLVNRTFGLSGNFTHRERDSSGLSKGPAFSINTFTLTLTLQR